MDNQLSLGIDETQELSALWKQALQRSESRLGREAIESWLSDASPIDLKAGRLVLGVPNATARAWVEKKYGRMLTEALTALRGESVGLEVVVRKPGAKTAKNARSEASPTSARPRVAASTHFAPIPLNEKYTFANFVVGQSNRFAHAAASAVAETPGKEFNPLFIYGGVGLGKTHLLQAIGHVLRSRDSRTRVAYISGETFTSHFITSLRERKEEEFRRAYRGVDIWLVDDIQFIADKTSTKEEFFHTFNELYLTNRQIVLASDRAPRELRLMEDRLRTRLESGLMVEVVPPELEMRMAILERRAEMEGADVPPEVIYQIARTVTQNIRVLEAALIRMLALASLNQSPMTAELAAGALGAFVQDAKLTCINLAVILQSVCEYFKISESDLVSPRRDRPICLARQVAMYLMRDMSRQSLSEIGQMFGGKAHSTVLYACTKLEREMKEDPSLEIAVRTLRGQLAGKADPP